jgi:hypothetical protein
MEFTDSDMVVPSEIVLRIAEYVVWSGERVSGFGLSCKAAAATTEAVAARTLACARFWDAVRERLFQDGSNLSLKFGYPYARILTENILAYSRAGAADLVRAGLFDLQLKAPPCRETDYRQAAALRALVKSRTLRVCFAEAPQNKWWLVLTSADWYVDITLLTARAGPLFVPGSVALAEKLDTIEPKRCPAVSEPSAKRPRLN